MKTFEALLRVFDRIRKVGGNVGLWKTHQLDDDGYIFDIYIVKLPIAADSQTIVGYRKEEILLDCQLGEEEQFLEAYILSDEDIKEWRLQPTDYWIHSSLNNQLLQEDAMRIPDEAEKRRRNLYKISASELDISEGLQRQLTKLGYTTLGDINDRLQMSGKTFFLSRFSVGSGEIEDMVKQVENWDTNHENGDVVNSDS